MYSHHGERVGGGVETSLSMSCFDDDAPSSAGDISLHTMCYVLLRS
jgi:hypothetical protein